MRRERGENRIPILYRVSSAIVAGRFVIFALFAAACVLCSMMLGKVKTNSDLSYFLPPEMETRRGMTIMSEEFATYATASVFFDGISEEDATSISEQISEHDRVALVTFDTSEDYYKDGKALIVISFDGVVDDDGVAEAMKDIEGLFEGKEYTVFSNIGQDFNARIASEMGGVLLISAIVILAVLLFTSRSYFEVVIFFAVFAVAALLNMGTNFIFGEISSITNSVAVILQLALAIDYAIIFAHRYQDEAALSDDNKKALTTALARSIVEVASSSLTTISGLAALTLMQFRLGRDLGLVLGKGIICSMLTVLLLMPGLLSLFPKLLKKTAHKNLVPSLEGWGRHLVRRRLVYILIFALVLPAAVFFSSKTEYAFSDAQIDEIVKSESREEWRRVEDTFGSLANIAVIVPRGDYEAQRSLISDIKEMDGVKSVTGLADIKYDGVKSVTDKVKLGELMDRFGVTADDVPLLSMLGIDISEAEFSVVEIADMIDISTLGAEDGNAELAHSLKLLNFATSQLRGENYERIIVSSTLPIEGEEGLALVDAIKEKAVEYCGDESLVIGDITSARDLKESYKSDSVLIAILTIVFVFLILFATFRSPVAAILLVFVIQGSIWINFSIPYLFDFKCSFVTQMIVSAIQMGATIDYAIVMLSRYRAKRETCDKKTAVALAVAESFPTVITSGAILSVAALLIAFRVSDVYIGHIGFAVGRGAIISIVLVLTVLPALIMLFDGLITKTTIRTKK